MFSYNSTQNTNFIGLPFMMKKSMNIKVKFLFEQLLWTVGYSILFRHQHLSQAALIWSAASKHN